MGKIFGTALAVIILWSLFGLVGAVLGLLTLPLQYLIAKKIVDDAFAAMKADTDQFLADLEFKSACIEGRFDDDGNIIPTEKWEEMKREGRVDDDGNIIPSGSSV